MTDREMLPCPFCSGSPLTETFDVGSRFTATVECEDCGAHLAAADGTDSGAIQQVVAAWNMRTTAREMSND